MIKENVDLKPYTYFKIGGSARYFADVSSLEELKEAIQFSRKKKVPFVIFGAASNVLVADHGYQGLVIRMLLRDVQIDDTLLTAGAGVPNAIAVSRAVTAGLGGFEWAVGIPGSIGGSIRGNAGCFSGEIKDVLESVQYLDTKTGKLKEVDNAFCTFGYRDSIFKKNPQWIILSGTFRLRKSENPGLGQRLVRYYTSQRSDKQDIGSSSAGCIFKNVAWPTDEHARRRLLSIFPYLGDFADSQTIPVGFLIDRLGLKGKTIGKASISRKHGNYLLNNGGATAEEVIMLIGLVKEYVHRKYNLHLEEEIQYVGF